MDRNLVNENRFIFVLLLGVLFWLFTVTPKANASWNPFAKSATAGPCKNVQIPSYESATKHMDTAEGLLAEDAFCPAIAHLKRAFIDATTPETREKAWFLWIEASFYQRDYETLFYRGEAFLKEKGKIKNLTSGPRVQYLMIMGAFEVLQQQGKKSVYQTLLMGTHPEQKDEESRKVYYSINDFFERWPNSIYTDELKQLQQILRDGVSGDLLQEARKLWNQKQYVPAMSRMKFVVNQGAYLKDFDVALYELISVTDQFSYAIVDEKWVPTERLATWMNLPAEQITAELRKETAAKLKQEALQMVAMMRDKLPDSAWTKKLDEFFPVK